MSDRPAAPWTRRELFGVGLGAVGAVVAGGGLVQAWRQLGREDLVPGEPVDVALRPRAWSTTPDQLSFAALGDNGSGGRQAMAVAEQMSRSYDERPFGHVSLLGDICYYGPIEERFDQVFLAPMASLIDAGVEFELAIGNHDGDLWLGQGGAKVEDTLRLLGTPARYYTVRRGPADFFYLDSRSIVSGGASAVDQLDWLDGALRSSTARWRIVCTHHPAYSSGVHGGSVEIRDAVEPILREARVDLVLAGHDHHYERSFPLHGITHVVSGGGCKVTPVWPASHTAVAHNQLQFLRVDIDGPRLTGTAVDVRGRHIDRFELEARA